MSDYKFNHFEVTLEAKYYLPIIVEEVYNFRQALRVTDSGLSLSAGDVLVSSINSKGGLSTQLFVTEVDYTEDLFENYVLIDVSLVTNLAGMHHVSDMIGIGDELKLFGNAHGEK
jgi:hypothetical protein